MLPTSLRCSLFSAFGPRPAAAFLHSRSGQGSGSAGRAGGGMEAANLVRGGESGRRGDEGGGRGTGKPAGGGVSRRAGAWKRRSGGECAGSPLVLGARGRPRGS